MRLLVVLLFVVLMAGCSEPGGSRKVTVGPNNGTWTPALDPREVPPGQHLWESYGGGLLVLDASQREARASLRIPEGAQTMVVNLTLVEGALVEPRGSLAGCSWQDDQTWIALGQTLQFGCDDPAAGNGTLVVSHEGYSARLRWSAEGVVQRCVTGAAC